MMKRILLIGIAILMCCLTFGQGIAGAARSNNSKMVKSLIKKGGDVNAVDTTGTSALAYAIINNNISLVKRLLRANAVVDASAIIANAQSGNKKIFKLITNKGFNVNAKNDSGDTPIIHALKTDNFDLFSLLLLNGADLNITDVNGNSPLLLAIKNNLADKYVNPLVTAKPDFNRANSLGETPLTLALTNKNESLMQRLISAGADINVADRNGLTPLWFALEANNIGLVEGLIKKGANSGTTRNGLTPVLFALSQNNSGLLKKLVSLGADVNADGQNGDTPLMYALKMGRMSDFDFLLGQPGININKANKYGFTLLDNAFKTASSTFIKSLMAKGAKFGPAQERNNITPLMYAIEYDKHELIYAMIDGATINKESFYGKTALILAIEKGNVQLAQELLNRGAGVGNTKFLRNCPLGYAVAHNRPNIVRMLLNKGADVNCRNKYDSTPLIEAAYYDRAQIARMLIAAGADRNFRANMGDTAYDVAKKQGNKAVLAVLSR